MAVTESELEALLKRHRWTINSAQTGNQKAFSAKQRRGKRTASRYIGTESKLRDMTEADVLAKLNRSSEKQ